MDKINATHINQYITFSDTRWNSVCAGIYVGIRKSEWTGEQVHFFEDGHINGIKQDCFTFPVDQTEEHIVLIDANHTISETCNH